MPPDAPPDDPPDEPPDEPPSMPPSEPDEPPDEPPPGILTPPGMLTPPPPGIPEPLLPPLISIEEQPVTKNAAATATIIGLANCAFTEIDGGCFMVFAS